MAAAAAMAIIKMTDMINGRPCFLNEHFPDDPLFFPMGRPLFPMGMKRLLGASPAPVKHRHR